MASKSAALKDPRTLTTLPEILSSLSAFQSEETQLSNSLSQLLSSRDPIISSLNRLQSLIPELEALHDDALSLSSRVSSTALTAERVGGRVQSLDEEMRRIREAGDHVGQVIELKSSLAAIQSAVESKDWESATTHCAKAMSLPDQVISGPFAEKAVPTSESHLPPAQTLQSYREQLLAIFQKNFEQASLARDASLTTRFFKLFPAIGWESEGLQAYATFVVDLVRVRTPASAKTSSPLYYITALTALFENIAVIVDQHQPVVEKYYGPNKMKKVVDRLLGECDRVSLGLISSWEEERSMKRKLQDVLSHPPQPLYSSIRRPANSEDDTLDAREVDRLLTETSGMAGRWNLFKKFIVENVSDGEHGTDAEKQGKSQGEEIESTASAEAFKNILWSYYLPMEVWYIRTIVDKTHRLSTTDSSQAIVNSTTPDDVFYILKVVLLRLISTGSTDAVEQMMTQTREIMERDYIGVMKKKLDDVYRGTAPSGPGPRSDRADRENRIAFMTTLNDLDVSISHLEQLIRDLVNGSAIGQHFLEQEQVYVKEQLTSFSEVKTKIASTLRMGLEQLFNQLVRPKLRTFISDIHKDVSYNLDEESYSAAEYNDVVRKRFVKAWDSLLDGYKETLTENNFRLMFGLTLDVLLRPWEKYLMTFKFTELGAIRFDRDLRSITTYLASQTAFGDTREKFVRLQQMSTLLNLDREEDVDEFYNSSGITWRLSAEEAKAMAALMV